MRRAICLGAPPPSESLCLTTRSSLPDLKGIDLLVDILALNLVLRV